MKYSIVDEYKKEKFEQEKARFKDQGFDLREESEDLEIEPKAIKPKDGHVDMPHQKNVSISRPKTIRTRTSTARKHRIPFRLKLPRL